MSNFGARLAYPVPARVAAKERRVEEAQVTEAAHAARPARAIAGLGRTLSDLARRWVAAQVRVAGPPWDGAHPNLGVYTTPFLHD